MADWAVRPIRCRTASASATTSYPATRAVPDVGRESVVIIRTVVVLPAPLGPSIEKTDPSGTVKLTPSTAVKSPNLLTRSTASMAGALIGWPGRGPGPHGDDGGRGRRRRWWRAVASLMRPTLGAGPDTRPPHFDVDAARREAASAAAAEG